MAISVVTPHLSDLHMAVLVALAAHGSADAEEIAGWLGLPLAVVEALCAELEAAGQLTLSRGD
jgi:DNA-binding MarR family transcriptional regulator